MKNINKTPHMMSLPICETCSDPNVLTKGFWSSSLQANHHMQRRNVVRRMHLVSSIARTHNYNYNPNPY